MRFTKLTREYLGGILGGFGLGVITATYLTRREIINSQSQLPAELWIIAFLLIAVGSILAFSAQRERK